MHIPKCLKVVEQQHHAARGLSMNSQTRLRSFVAISLIETVQLNIVYQVSKTLTSVIA